MHFLIKILKKLPVVSSVCLQFDGNEIVSGNFVSQQKSLKYYKGAHYVKAHVNQSC